MLLSCVSRDHSKSDRPYNPDCVAPPPASVAKGVRAAAISLRNPSALGVRIKEGSGIMEAGAETDVATAGQSLTLTVQSGRL